MFYYKDQPILGQRGPSGPDGNPLGTVISFMGLTAPDGYLACDGAVYNIADYTELAFFFRAQFGAENYFGGDGVTTFAVPDLRNLFLRGYHGEAEEQLSGEIGQRQEGTTAAIPHIFGNGVTGFPLKGPAIKDADKEFQHVGYYGYRNDGSSTDSTNTLSYIPRPMNIAVLYCIKALPSDPVLEEYDTDDGWHVRKWSDGYVEMVYSDRKIYTGYSVSIQGVLWSKIGVAKHLPFPVKLVEKYREAGSVSSFSVSNTTLLMTEGDDTEFYLDKTQNYRLMAFSTSAISRNQDIRMEIFVTGRWK